jgi:hypothetical protein
MTDEARGPDARRWILAAMSAVLSDDHNHERGLVVLRQVVAEVVQEDGPAGLSEFAVALSLELAHAVERIASDQGSVAVDLAEIWFAE